MNGYIKWLKSSEAGVVKLLGIGFLGLWWSFSGLAMSFGDFDLWIALWFLAPPLAAIVIPFAIYRITHRDKE